MTIKDRNLIVGMTLVGKYHKQEHKCQVVQGEREKLRYRLEDNREFKSPSAAGMAITGHACDGWVFWSVETTQPANAPATETPQEASVGVEENTSQTVLESAHAPKQVDAPTMATVVAAPESTAAKKSFHRTPNQKGVTEGQTRWIARPAGRVSRLPTARFPQLALWVTKPSH